MLAEDTSTDALMIRRAFTKTQLQGTLEVADDGDKAVAYLSGQGKFADRVHHPLPVLLLLDLKLPRRSGFEVLAWIRQQAELKRLPVVLTSSRRARTSTERMTLGRTPTVSSFWLPLADGELSPAPTSSEAVSGRPLCVLIVEDNRDAADSLRMVLELTGHKAQVSYTGQQAVETAKKTHPGVVLCDLGLPGGMSGSDVARALREVPQTADVRLIAISGYGQPEDQERARDAGFDLPLTKSVTPDDLQRILADKA